MYKVEISTVAMMVSGVRGWAGIGSCHGNGMYLGHGRGEI